mmetsp:Transcript_39887/g.70164  ORF Transcript_39887/g.70164 Transcript_39887/m.70164 type:complete len:560 (+) Transcript_39887:28-1707(+)
MSDAKSQLNKFLQTYLGRPVTKQDVVYKVTKFHEGMQATLVCPCIEDGYEFVGEIGKDNKEAEKHAAQQALQVYLDLYGEAVELAAMKKVQGKGKSKGKSPIVKDVLSRFEVAEVAGVGGSDPKSRLSNFLSRYLGRPTTKQDMTYTVEKYDEGFQATLLLHCFDGHVVTGEVASTAKEAEFRAAELALEAYQEELGEVPPSQSSLRKSGGCEKGAGKDAGAAGGKGGKGYQWWDSGFGKAKGKCGNGQFGKGKDFGAGGYGAGFKGKGYGFQQWGAQEAAWFQQDAYAGEWAPSLGPQAMPALGPPASWANGKGGSSGKNEDPKSKLNVFLQRVCRRPVTKEEIKYQVEPVVGGGFQATLTLTGCVEEVQVFEGGVGRTEKEAEKLVAQQAVNAYAAEIEAIPVGKKQKRPADDLGSGNAGEPSAKRPREVGPGAVRKTEKTELNTACMKIIRRPLTKGEIVFQTVEVALEGMRGSSSYQSTVSVPFLQDGEGNHTWTGEAYATKQEAEHSAAGIALAAILAVPEYMEIHNAPPASRQRNMEQRKNGVSDLGNCGVAL